MSWWQSPEILIQPLLNGQPKEKRMNRSELFNAVKSWLEAGKISFVADHEEKTFRFRVNADNGLFDVRLLCEDEPTVLQALSPVPVRIPEEKVSETGLLLHNINARLRIGAFQFHVEERVVEFRLTMPIRPESPLADQFSQTVATTLNTMDEYVRSLGLLACATPESQQTVAKLSPSPEATGSSPRLASGRLELN
jgi:hypothetical protein